MQVSRARPSPNDNPRNVHVLPGSICGAHLSEESAVLRNEIYGL